VGTTILYVELKDLLWGLGLVGVAFVAFRLALGLHKAEKRLDAIERRLGLVSKPSRSDPVDTQQVVARPPDSP
jgi:hypothetical protein